MGLWEQFGNAFQYEKLIPNIPDIPKMRMSGSQKSKCGDNGDIGDKHLNPKKEHGTRPPTQEDANSLLAELDLSRVRERYYTGNTDSPAHSSTADKKRPGSQGQETPAHRTASISLPADNRPQGDMLKELLLPFQPWPATLSLDSAGRIQVKASRLLLPRVQDYCEQHGPELQAFLKSRPGHTWSTMRKSR